MGDAMFLKQVEVYTFGDTYNDSVADIEASHVAIFNLAVKSYHSLEQKNLTKKDLHLYLCAAMNFH